MKFFSLPVLALIATISLTACGDDSSSVFPDAVGDLPSSSAKSDDAPASSGDNSSGSSVKSSTSGKSSAKSSSSEKSSSSTGSKSSSSVKPGSSVSFALSSARSSTSYTECKEEGKMISRYNSETGMHDWYICQDSVYVLLVLSSSSAQPRSSYIDMDSLYNSTLSYGEFTDPRDGQTYRTIVEKPGWVSVPEFEAFAQNLNYGVQIKLDATEFDDSKVEKYCYDDDPWYCDNGFGGLYSWSEAMGLPKACDSVWTGTTPACPDSIFPGWKYEEEWRDLMIQGACPEGWHVMNETEWRALVALDVTGTGWALFSVVSRGSNSTGFSALYGGMTELLAQYVRIMELGVYHLPLEHEAERHKSVTMSNQSDISYRGVHYKKDGLSVRCVKDY